jgi:hypothetical protein
MKELDTYVNIEGIEIETVIVYQGNTKDYPEVEIDSLYMYDQTRQYCAPKDVSFLIPALKEQLINIVAESL